MKRVSLYEIIAISFVLLVGSLTLMPFTQTSDADGPSHSYTITVDVVDVTVCEDCGAALSYESGGTTTLTLTHPNYTSHATGGTVYRYYESGYCDNGVCGYS